MAHDRLARELATRNTATQIERISSITKTNGTSNGVSYSWNGNTCSINGTGTAISFNVISDNRTSLPAWMTPGAAIFVKVNTSNESVRFNLAWYLADGKNKFDYFTTDSICVIPENAVGVIIRLSLMSGVTYANDSIEVALYDAPTNEFLGKKLFEVDDIVGKRIGNNDNPPMLTIIDDDGNEKFYTDLFPVCKSNNVSIATAIPFSLIDTNEHLTLDQVKEIHQAGVEVLSHTYSHATAGVLNSEQEYEMDYRKAKYCFSEIGINADILVYAGSTGSTVEAREAAKRVYNGAIHSGGEINNTTDDNKYQLKRYGISDSTDNGRINGNELEQLKMLIDNTLQNGGWMIWMLHTSSAYWSETMKNNIASAVEYALDNSLPIVTAEYGFKTYYGS